MSKLTHILKDLKFQNSRPVAQHVFEAYVKGCLDKYGLNYYEILWFKKQEVSDNFVLSFHIPYKLSGEFCPSEQVWCSNIQTKIGS